MWFGIGLGLGARCWCNVGLLIEVGELGLVR